MPWGKVPMKDAIAAILSRELQTSDDLEVSEWGNPARVMPGHPLVNQIVSVEGTRGTETSKYPEEKKTYVIAQVVASERAGA